MKKGENTNHPKEGSSINIEPIRKKSVIADIKKLLRDRPLDYALFVVGINTNLRASDLLNLTVEQVVDLKKGDSLEVKEKKTGKQPKKNEYCMLLLLGRNPICCYRQLTNR